MKIITALGIASLVVLGAANKSWGSDSPADVVWGSETNGVCVGLFNLNGQLANKHAAFEIWLKSSTNGLRPFVVPKIPFQFDLSVFDEKGNLVPRTANGKKIGEKLPRTIEIKHGKERELQRVFLEPQMPTAFKNNNFDLFNYFEITKPGKYRVEFEQRLQMPLTAYTFQGIVLPKVTISIDIK